MAEGVEVAVLNSRYFCYHCNREVSVLTPAELTCPNCSGDFLEEVSSISSNDHDEYEDESDVSENEVLNLLRFNDLVRRTVMNSVSEEDDTPSPRNFSEDDEEADSAENEGFPSVRSMLQELEEHFLSSHRFRNLEDYIFSDDIDTLSTMLLNDSEIVGPPPLPKEQIKLLPTISVSKEHVDKGVQCTICMEDFCIREKAKNLPCEHFYHEICITPWLERHGTCPNCRKVVEMPPKSRRSQSCPGSDLNTDREQRRFSESSSFSDFFTTSINPFRFL